MTQPPTTVPISTALVLDPEGKLLWTWDDEWGCFALPMTRPKVGASDLEQPGHAARRAGAAALGVPVRVGQHARLDPELFVSRRDFTMRRYQYNVFRIEPHPDFATAVAVRGPHLWLTAHRALSGDYEPFSDSCRWVVGELVGRGLIPGRSQHTAALVLRRTHNGKHQFLLRQEPGWGYALPTARRAQGENYAAAAHRCAREELGLDPAVLGLTQGRATVITARDLSRTENVPTFYCHGVFEGEPPAGAAFRSANPLVWADAREVLVGRITDRLTPDGQKAPDDMVSPTARHILQELDHVPLVDTDAVTP